MLIRFVILICLSIWFPDAYKRWTHGFRLAKCEVAWPSNPEWEVDAPNEEVLSILKQPFSYLSKGKQCYVFVSHDQKYVLKFFKWDTTRIPYGQEIQKWIKESFGARFRYSVPRTNRLAKSFNSCKLAYSIAPKQTGVVYVHLNPNRNHLPNFQIRDRIGIRHTVNPERHRFVLQKKAVPILKCINSENLEKFQKLLDEISDLGLFNLDLTWQRNFGMIDGEPIQMDIGDFIYSPERAKQNANHYKKAFESWLRRSAVSASF